MLKTRVAAYVFALTLLVVGSVPLALADGGPFELPSGGVVAWAATCYLMALGVGMLLLLTPRRY